MFDLDNTLGDRAAAVRAWAAGFCAERALPTEATDWLVEVDNDGYSDRREVFTALADRYGLQSSIDELVGDYQRRIIGLTPEVEGATETLHRVRGAGHKIAIVTNGDADHLGVFDRTERRLAAKQGTGGEVAAEAAVRVRRGADEAKQQR